MRTVMISSIVLLLALGASGNAVRGQSGAGRGVGAQAAPAAPKDKAAYFPNSDIQAVWKDLEARQVINQRALDGGTFSVNIRIVKEGDAPLVHAASADVWLVTAGTATAITGGQLADPQKRPNVDDAAGTAIRGGTEQALAAGDVLFVPAGVPHGFKNVKGFRAFLIRFDTK
jgi:mannose-6-phosphate isomerase-like protein (cupin superfamily)